MLKKIYIFILAFVLCATPIFATETETETGSALEQYLKSIDERLANTLESMNNFQQQSTDRLNDYFSKIGDWLFGTGEEEEEPTKPLPPYDNGACYITNHSYTGTHLDYSTTYTINQGHNFSLIVNYGNYVRIPYTSMSSTTGYVSGPGFIDVNLSFWKLGWYVTNCYDLMLFMLKQGDLPNKFNDTYLYVGYGDPWNAIPPDDDINNPTNPDYVNPLFPIVPKKDFKVRFNIYWWDFPALVQLPDGTYAIRTVGTTTLAPVEPEIPDLPGETNDKDGLPKWDDEKQDFDDGDDGFWSKIFKFVWDMIKKIFVPENNKNGDNFITIEFNKMNTELNNKLPVVKQFNVMFDTVLNDLENNPKYNSSVAPTFKITAFGSSYDIIDFSFLDDYIGLIHGIIQFCAYFLFGRKVLKRLPSIIRGI